MADNIHEKNESAQPHGAVSPVSNSASNQHPGFSIQSPLHNSMGNIGNLPGSAPETATVRIGHPRYDTYITFSEMQLAKQKLYKRKDGVKVLDSVGFGNRLLRALYSAEYLAKSGIQLEGRHCIKDEAKFRAVVDELNQYNMNIDPDSADNHAWKLFRQNVNALCRRCRFEVAQSESK